jgi:hypothetical protein
MSVGSLGGVIGSAAGAPLSQTKGSEAERIGRDSAAVQREANAAEQADRAGGIGQTEQDGQASERDADGRRPWEAPTRTSAADAESNTTEETRQSKDPTGITGTRLDLTG